MRFSCPFNDAQLAIRTAIKALTPGPLDGNNPIKLMKNNPAIGPTTVLADIEEATYTGYAGLTTTEDAAIGTDPTNGKAIALLKAPELGWFFQAGSPFVSGEETIYGVYMTNVAGTAILGVGKFTTPVIISAASEFVLVGDLMLEFPNPILV